MEYLRDNDIETIKRLDETIKNNVLQKNIVLTRYVDDDIINVLFKQNPILNNVESEDLTIKYFKDNRITLEDKGFMSTSITSKLNVFSWKKVRLDINVKKGSYGFMTENVEESEFILPRNSKIKVNNIYFDSEKEQVRITTTLED